MQRFSFPIAGIIALVALGILSEIFFVSRGAELSDGFQYLWAFSFSYCVACWVETDRKAKALHAPFEYQAFVFFLWPVVAPYYLFHTRRWRGLFQGAGLIVLYSLPTVAALLTYLLMEEPG